VNVLATPRLTVREIVDAGAQRISVGGRLAWAAVSAFAAAAEQMRDEGSFAGLDVSPPVGDWLA
jgi:2-methylisocitrate lyase-like PEP mutase family enzyme